MPHAIDTEPSAPSIIGSPAPERTNLDLASVDDEYSDNVPFDHGDFDAQTRDRVRNAVCRANRTVMRELVRVRAQWLLREADFHVGHIYAHRV